MIELNNKLDKKDELEEDKVDLRESFQILNKKNEEKLKNYIKDEYTKFSQYQGHPVFNEDKIFFVKNIPKDILIG